MAKKKTFKDYTALGTISASLILRNLPFVLFLCFLGVIYIANAHYSEKTVREIQRLQEEVQELRWRYMSLQAENMYNSKLTEVERRVRPLGLRPHDGNVKTIMVERPSE